MADNLSFKQGLYSNINGLQKGDFGFATYDATYGTIVIKDTNDNLVYTMPAPGGSGLPLLGQGDDKSPAYGILGISGGGTGTSSITTNRLLYAHTDDNDNNIFTAGNHYVNNTKLAINYTSKEPDENLYVNGATKIVMSNQQPVVFSNTETNKGVEFHFPPYYAPCNKDLPCIRFKFCTTNQTQRICIEIKGNSYSSIPVQSVYQIYLRPDTTSPETVDRFYQKAGYCYGVNTGPLRIYGKENKAGSGVYDIIAELEPVSIIHSSTISITIYTSANSTQPIISYQQPRLATGTQGDGTLVKYYNEIVPTCYTTTAKGKILMSNGTNSNPIFGTPSMSWTGGKGAGPVFNYIINGTTVAGLAIPSASATASGVVTTTTQTFAGDKTFAGILETTGGTIRIHNEGTTYIDLKAHRYAANGDESEAVSRTTYLRDHGGTAYLVATNTRDAVGSTTMPVYVNNKGVVTACTEMSTLSGTGTVIPESADLQTEIYLKVGSYCQGSGTIVRDTFKNCPVATAFKMEVMAPISKTIDDETTGGWVYRIRKIIPFNTGIEYVQCVTTSGTPRDYTWGPWTICPQSVISVTSGAGATLTNGASNTPIYIGDSGRLTTCDIYAGGTSITLNGESKAANTASFYAPVNAGTDGYILKAGGTDTAPSWIQSVPIENGGTGTTSITENRLLYATNSAITASSHYIDSTKIAINSTTAPGENLYVNGHSRFNGSILPETDLTWNIGSLEKSFKTICAKALYLKGANSKINYIVGSNPTDNDYYAKLPNYSGTITISINADLNPSTGTAYYIPFYSTTGQAIQYNNGLQYYTLEGTDTQTGSGTLILGNGTSTGSPGNKRGTLRIYGPNNIYTNIMAANLTKNRNVYIRDYGVDTTYFVGVSSASGKGSTSLPVYVDANGLVQTCSLDDRYLKLSGGTITGSLTVNNSISTKTLTITNTSSTGGHINFSRTDNFNYLHLNPSTVAGANPAIAICVDPSLGSSQSQLIVKPNGVYLNNRIIGRVDFNYGEELPTDNLIEGRIFFKLI